MEPRLEEAARILANENPPIQIAKIDAEANKMSLTNAGVTAALPAMKICRSGVFEDWNAGGGKPMDASWQTDGIVDRMRTSRGPSSVELTESGDLQRFSKKELDEVAVLGYFPKGTDHGDFKVFHAVAHRFRGKLPFYHVTSQALLERAGHLGRQSAIITYRPWGGKRSKLMYRSPLTKNSLGDWVGEVRTPPIEWVDKAGFAVRTERKLPILRAFVDPAKRTEQSESLRAALAPLCEEHSRYLVCAITDAVPAQVPEEERRPDGWDEEDDGVWQPKMIDNPEFEAWRGVGIHPVDTYGFDAEDVGLHRALVIEEAQRKRPASFVYDGSGVGGAVGEGAADWVARWRRKKAPRWSPSKADDADNFIRPASAGDDDA